MCASFPCGPPHSQSDQWVGGFSWVDWQLYSLWKVNNPPNTAIVGSYICMTWSVLYKQMEPWAHILSISTNFQVSSKHGVCSDSLLISQKGPDFPPPTRTCCGFTRAVERQWLYLMVIYWSKIQAAVMRLRLVFVSSCSQRSNLALPHWMDSNTLILLSTVQ